MTDFYLNVFIKSYLFSCFHCPIYLALIFSKQSIRPYISILSFSIYFSLMTLFFLQRS